MQKKDLNRLDSLPNLPTTGENAAAPEDASGADKKSDGTGHDCLAVHDEGPRQGEHLVLANVSHEVRTALQGIMEMAEALSKVPLPLDQRTSVRLLRTSAVSLLDVVDNLAALSLLETKQVELVHEEFDPRQLVFDVFHVLDIRARQRGLHLFSEIQQDVPVLLKGDAHRLRQVVTNLVVNAIQFTHSGQVSMTVSLATRSPGGPTLQFVVTDAGMGIPADRQAALFQAFVQVETSASRPPGGTSLGLRIAAQLVELMGGAIWLETTMDQGSRLNFTAKFGWASPAEVSNAPVPHKNPPTRLGQGTVLLAEDNFINQFVTVRILEGQGHRVLVASNGRLALEILERQPIDIILMDIQMPEMDGFQATRAIRDREAITGAHVPIIALTAHAMQGYRQTCLDAGMDDYISKPVSGKDLLEVVNRALLVTQCDARE